MKIGSRRWQALAIVALTCLAASVAQASIVSAPVAFFSGASTVDWGQLNGGSPLTFVNVGATANSSPAGTVVTISNWGHQGELVTGAIGWNGSSGGFAPGSFVLDSNNPGGTTDVLTLSFAGPVSAVGFYIQVWQAGDNFTATLTDTTSSHSDVETSCCSSGVTSNNPPIWVGLKDDTGTASISSVTISLHDNNAADQTSNDYYGIGALSVVGATTPSNGNGNGNGVPEPGSILLVATGALGLGFKAWKSSHS